MYFDGLKSKFFILLTMKKSFIKINICMCIRQLSGMILNVYRNVCLYSMRGLWPFLSFFSFVILTASKVRPLTMLPHLSLQAWIYLKMPRNVAIKTVFPVT